MKNILILICLIPLGLFAQDKYPYELPEYSTVANDSTDVLYIDDSGIDKHIEMPTFLGVINDTADILRAEFADTTAALRGEIGGASGWSAAGNYMYLTTTTDSVGVGTNVPGYKFDVIGNSRIYGNLGVSRLNLSETGGSGAVYSTGDDLFFTDNNNSLDVSLSSLISGLFSLTTTTRYATTTTNNWHFGGNTATTYKHKVTGSGNYTGDLTLDSYLRFGNNWQRSSSIYIGGGIDLGSTGSTSYATLGFAANKVYFATDFLDLMASTTTPTAAAGRIFADDDGNILGSGDGVTWDTLTNGGGGGSGTIDTTGLPVAGQYAYFTSATTLGSTDNLTFKEDTIYGINLKYVLFEDDDVGTLFAMNDDYLQLTSENTQFFLYGAGDTAVIKAPNGLRIYDSTYLMSYIGDPDVWLTLSSTGAIDTAHTVDAGFMLTLSPFPSIHEYMDDIVDGELSWLYKEHKTGLIKSNRGLKGLRPTEVINALMGQIERNLRFTHELTEKNEVLESELRKTQAELDDLKRVYDQRLTIMEQAILKRLAE